MEMISCFLLAAVALLPPQGTNLTFRALSDGAPKLQDWMFHPETHDFTPYNRCVLDYLYLGEDGEPIHFFFAGKTEVFGKHDVLASRRIIKAGPGRWVFGLSNWPKCTDPKMITRIRLAKDNTAGAELVVKGMTLLRPDEPDLPPVALTEEERSRFDAFVKERSARHARAFRGERDALAAKFRDAGLKADGLVFGVADSMARVRPREGFDASAVHAADRAAVSLARNEHEAVQVVAMPTRGTVRNLRLVCEGAADGVTVTCAPMGYVRTTDQPSYAMGFAKDGRHGCQATGVGWWPDPILAYTNACDIAVDDVQSFWVSAHASAGVAAGVRHLHLVFSTSAGRVFEIPFEVTVRDFALPRTAPMPILTAFNPRPAGVKGLKDDPDAPCNLWKRQRDAWGDFLADHYLMMDDIYSRDFRYLDQLKRMKAQGRLGAFSLGYFNPAFGDGVSWKGRHLADFRRNLAAAKEAGILDKAWFYGADEVPSNHLFAVDHAARILHAEFPGVPVLTTAQDYTHGKVAANLDGFCPLTECYVRYADTIPAARAAGKKVWWYVCNNPGAPWANLYVECPPIEARLLMGAMAVRERTDGFLYYELALWNSKRPISGGPFTDWNPATVPRCHGDGSWVCCGPDGMPLSTQRFENFRDGLEDLAYAKLAESKSGRRIDVPQNVMRTMTDYTYDPANVRAWRDRLAEELSR